MTRDDPLSIADSPASKRRRPPSDTCNDAVDRNGIIVDDVPIAKDATKKHLPPGSQTRSKQKNPVDVGEVRQDVVAEDGDKQAKNISQSTRSSSRSQKKLQRDIDSSSSCPMSRKPESGKQESLPDPVKTRRSWELWSVDDKNTFFEALCEYGKDFESIQHYIAQKNKKKSHLPQLIKNKDQVRHFYYRTWHKISKYLGITDDIKKQTQELYGLINYGELRKKIGGRMDEKNGQKLKELVHHGATSIRCKGKNQRVKTPICRALKKLNLVADPKEDQMMKLPSRLTVEFQPQTNAAWAQVQSTAQNPRLRMTMSLQRRLSSVISYLQRKWKPHRLKQRDSLTATFAESLTQTEETCCMRVLPKKDASVTLVSMRTMSEIIKSKNVSLQSYRDNVMEKDACSVDAPKKMGRGKSKAVLGRHVDEHKSSTEEKLTDNEAHLADSENKDSKLPKNGTATVNQEKDEIELMLKQLMQPKVADNVEINPCAQTNCLASPTSVDANDDAKLKVTSPHETELPVDKSTVQNTDEATSADQINRIRRGWNLKEAGTMTMGELYILMGYPNQLQLEYVWEADNITDSNTEQTTTDAEKNLATVLQKLLHLASSNTLDAVKAKQVAGSGSTCRCNYTCALHPNSIKSPLPRVAAPRNTTKIAKGPLPIAVAPEADVQRSVPGPAVKNVFLVPSAHPPQRSQLGVKMPIPSLQQKKLVPSDTSFRDQLDKLLPQNRKARGNLRKSVVVQRELSLLPKTPCSSSMMTLRFVPSASNLPGSFMPVLPVAVATNAATITNVLKLPASKVLSPATNAQPFTRNVFEVPPAAATIIPSTSLPHADAKSTTFVAMSSPMQTSTASSLHSTVSLTDKINVSASIASPTRTISHTTVARTAPVSSTITTVSTSPLMENPIRKSANPPLSISGPSPPPNISSLLELSLPTCESLQTDVPLGNTEKLLDISLGNSNSSFMDAQPLVLTTSPSNSMFKGHSVTLENVWLGGETEDISLSSLLGHLESPQKQSNVGPTSAIGHDSISQLSNDVDTQLQCMMNENSVDYIAKFADLAAQIATGDAPKKSATTL